MTIATVGRAGRWALTAAAVLALGAFGIGTASAEPHDGITGGAGNNGGVNVNMGPFGGGMNAGNNGGFNFGPNGIGAGGGQNNSANVNMGPFGGGYDANTGGGVNFGGR
ncbi:MAG: hypothetical protein WBA69_14530 [Mycobacterium sp.]